MRHDLWTHPRERSKALATYENAIQSKQPERGASSEFGGVLAAQLAVIFDGTCC